MSVHSKTTEEEIHQTLKITLNSIGIFCRKEGWQEADGTGLLSFK